MRVFVAGATGLIGTPLIRRLVAAGHEVIGLARTDEGADRVRRLRAAPVLADVMDREGLARALDRIRADAVIHQLTALKKAPARHRDMTATDVLRGEGTTRLLEAARMIGARRFVTQSIVFGYGYTDHGDRVLTEDSPFGALHGDPFDPHILAMVSEEEQVLHAEGIEGIALRYGLFYGADAGAVAAMLSRRSLPVARHGGRLAFVHHEDAAAATVAALERGRPGEAYNIVDDVPATFRDVITGIARSRQAPDPLVLPQWLLDLGAPYGGRVLGRVLLTVSNEKAKSELGWAPAYPSFEHGLRSAGASGAPS